SPYLPPSVCASFCTLLFLQLYNVHRAPHSFPTRRSSDLFHILYPSFQDNHKMAAAYKKTLEFFHKTPQTKSKKTHTSANANAGRSEEHTSELQSRFDLVCRLLLEKKKKSNVKMNKHQIQA